MKRWTCVAGLLTVLALAGLPAGAQDKVPEIKEVMRKLHKGSESLRAHGFDNLERPSRSTFDRFRRQFGAAFSIR